MSVIVKSGRLLQCPQLLSLPHFRPPLSKPGHTMQQHKSNNTCTGSVCSLTIAQCDSVQRAGSILLNMRLEKGLRDLLKSSTFALPHLSSVSSSHIRKLRHSRPRNKDFLETCVTVNPSSLPHGWSSPGNHIFPKFSYFCSPPDISYKRSM